MKTPRRKQSNTAKRGCPDTANEIPADFLRGMADCQQGRVADMETALTKSPAQNPQRAADYRAIQKTWIAFFRAARRSLNNEIERHDNPPAISHFLCEYALELVALLVHAQKREPRLAQRIAKIASFATQHFQSIAEQDPGALGKYFRNAPLMPWLVGPTERTHGRRDKGKAHKLGRGKDGYLAIARRLQLGADLAMGGLADTPPPAGKGKGSVTRWAVNVILEIERLRAAHLDLPEPLLAKLEIKNSILRKYARACLDLPPLTKQTLPQWRKAIFYPLARDEHASNARRWNVETGQRLGESLAQAIESRIPLR